MEDLVTTVQTVEDAMQYDLDVRVTLRRSHSYTEIL